MNRRGFTIIETVLAVVVGAMVLLGCVSVFLAANRAERSFSQRYERTSELWTTQLAVRKTFLSLLVEEQTANAPAAANTTEAETEPEPRARVILEPDMAAPVNADGVRPQRLEVTVARSPLPSILGSQLGSWLIEADREQTLDFTGASSAPVRGVFELRRSGVRELIMMNLGLTNAGPQEIRSLAERMAADPPPGWTLWWRPILSAELAELEAGMAPKTDTAGTPQEVQTRLAGAIALLRGVDALNWEIFKADQRVIAYSAAGITDLPAFVEVEVFLVNGQYASWMFEVGWETGEEPSESGSDSEADADGDGNGGGGGGGGNGNGNGNGNGGGNRPPGSGRPPGNGTPPPGEEPPPPGGARPPGSDGNFDFGGRRP